MRDARYYIEDILEAINAIERFLEGVEFKEFISNDEKSSAVIRKFEIVGEAAKNIPEELKQQYPNIPWREIAGFRDKLIHFYFGIKYELVWETIRSRLPVIKPVLEEMLAKLKKDKGQ